MARFTARSRWLLCLAVLLLGSCKGNYGELTGEWNSDWGKVAFTEGHGTYTDTYKTGPGTIELTSTGGRTFSGKWGESAKRHGTMTLTLSEDGRKLTGSWTPDADVTIGGKTGGSINWSKKR